MSWHIAADLREMFIELVATDGKTSVCGRTLSRKDQLHAGLAEALQHLPAEVNRAEANIFITSDFDRIAVREHWGAQTAFVSTEGFENSLVIGTHQRQNLFGLHASRPAPLVSRDYSFGVTERTNADGSIAVGLDEKEIEFVLSKLALTDVKAVAICFLHSTKNPHHEEQLAAKLREKGYEVVCSHKFPGNEVERARLACEHAFILPGRKTFIDEIEKLGFSRERILIKTDAPALTKTSKENTLAVEFLEDRVRVQIHGGELHELEMSPLCLVTLDEGGLVHTGPQSIEPEPGPVSFSKGLHLCVLDVMALGYKLNAQNFSRLKLDVTRASKQLAPIAKALRMDVDTCAKKYVQLSIHAMALEIQRHFDSSAIERSTLTATGWLAEMMAAPLAHQLGARKLLLPKGFRWQPAVRLLDGEAKGLGEGSFGQLKFTEASTFAEGMIHEL